jgi:acyl-CoA reductase-like NAD-dependent aldehyde dehydrogenase
VKVNMWINNQEVSTGEYQEAKDPGRLTEVVGHVVQGTADHVHQAVEAAYQAFLSWRETPLEDRIALVNKAADLLEREKEYIAEVTSKENGMLLSRSKGEVEMAVTGMRNLADLATSFSPLKEMEDETGWLRIVKKPMGVVAGIIPWNAPIVLAMQKLVPIVVTGNTIVFKPSPFASMGVTVALQKVAQLFPPGVVNVVLGDADVGEALTTHPLIRKISFTGGGPTAKAVMKSAAETLKGIHFELGGNDPAIILDDADLDKVIPKIVEAALRRSGQYCYAIKRVYAPQSLYDNIYEMICDQVKRYKIGHQLDERATMGPMNNARQYNSVKTLMERIKNSDAEYVELGEKLEPDNWENGYYLRPAVVRNLRPDAEIVTCEQFGPIIPLVAYQSEDEVIAMANKTEYGLGSSVWSTDFERALRVASRIEAGMTFINGAAQSPLGYKYMPFGGVKQSGLGWENSEVVFDEYIEYHSINYHKK